MNNYFFLFFELVDLLLQLKANAPTGMLINPSRIEVIASTADLPHHISSPDEMDALMHCMYQWLWMHWPVQSIKETPANAEGDTAAASGITITDTPLSDVALSGAVSTCTIFGGTAESRGKRDTSPGTRDFNCL